MSNYTVVVYIWEGERGGGGWGGEGVLAHSYPKSHRKKIDKIHENFELNLVLINNVLSQNGLITPKCILPTHTKRISLTFNTFQLYQ